MRIDPSLGELKSALTKSLDWIFRNRRYLFSEETDPTEAGIAELKPIGEFALVAILLKRTGYFDVRFEETLDEIWRRLEFGDKLLQILLCRPDIVALTTIYADFFELGYSHAGTDKLVKHLLRTPAALNMELPTWRKLDLLRARNRLLGVPGELDASQCWFWSEPEPWVISEDVLYALTHDIFYLTDFGQHKRAVADRQHSYLTTCLPSWLHLYRSNLDITAELGIVAYCLDERALSCEIAALIIDGQQSNGLIPSPPLGGENLLRSIKIRDDGHVTFLKNYHTSFVGGLCLAYALDALS